MDHPPQIPVSGSRGAPPKSHDSRGPEQVSHPTGHLLGHQAAPPSPPSLHQVSNSAAQPRPGQPRPCLLAGSQTPPQTRGSSPDWTSKLSPPAPCPQGPCRAPREVRGGLAQGGFGAPNRKGGGRGEPRPQTAWHREPPSSGCSTCDIHLPSALLVACVKCPAQCHAHPSSCPIISPLPRSSRPPNTFMEELGAFSFPPESKKSYQRKQPSAPAPPAPAL